MTGFARKVPYAEKISPAKAQRRKALPRFLGFLCAFAPWREKCFSTPGARCDYSGKAGSSEVLLKDGPLLYNLNVAPIY
jgi:hypothetical protein